MRNQELVSSLVSIGLAVIFMIGALKYGFGTFSRPGPGLLPFFASVFVMTLSGINVFISLAKKKGKGEIQKKFVPGKGILMRLMVGVLSLCGYGIALDYLGFFLTTVIFMIIILRFVSLKKNWAMIAGTSLLTALASYLLFVILLKTPLPTGIFL